MLLDAGNLLFKRKTIPAGPSQEKLTAAAIIDIHQSIGYDGVGVGPLDLAAGSAFIQESNSEGFPWISANVRDKSGELLFKSWRTKDFEEATIAITAITASPKRGIDGITIQPWREALSKTLKQIKEEVVPQFIILLSTLKSSENERITTLFPEINLIIAADMRGGNMPPKISGNCLITQTIKQGKYQGLLEILLGKQRVWGQDSSKVVANLQNKLGSINWQLRRLIKKAALAGNEDKYSSNIARLEKEKADLDMKVIAAKATLAQEEITGVVSDQYIFDFIGLKRNSPNDKPTVERLKSLNNTIKELHKKSKQGKEMLNNISRLTKDMVGHAVCETCHEVQAEFWKNTGHATAFATLVNKNKSSDLACLPCHLTILPLSETFKYIPAETYLSYPEALQSVGCESCHGAGKLHTIEPEENKMLRTPPEKLCLDCHTPEHDDNFEYPTKLSRISCPSE